MMIRILHSQVPEDKPLADLHVWDGTSHFQTWWNERDTPHWIAIPGIPTVLHYVLAKGLPDVCFTFYTNIGADEPCGCSDYMNCEYHRMNHRGMIIANCGCCETYITKCEFHKKKEKRIMPSI